MIEERRLREFIRESNHIEGIDGTPTDEVTMVRRFLKRKVVTVGMLKGAVGVFQPGAKLRDKVGMDVRVGDHIAPPGGSAIEACLADIAVRANAFESPYSVHCAFEYLHPFQDGNGRSGRLLWLWMMVKRHGEIPPLGFLHTWYYSSLAASHD